MDGLIKLIVIEGEGTHTDRRDDPAARSPLKSTLSLISRVVKWIIPSSLTRGAAHTFTAAAPHQRRCLSGKWSLINEDRMLSVLVVVKGFTRDPRLSNTTGATSLQGRSVLIGFETWNYVWLYSTLRKLVAQFARALLSGLGLKLILYFNLRSTLI